MAEQAWNKPAFVNETLLKPDITLEESQKLYKEWAKAGTYDTFHQEPKKYGALKILTETIQDLWPRDVLLLDVGAGTGLSGVMLQQAGYMNIHALEPLDDFAQTAREKGIYKKIIQKFIGTEEPLNIPDGTYDGIVSTGAFGPGHIPCSALPEMIRITKSGGYIVICMREEYLWTVPEFRDKLEPLMKKLEDQGKWTLAKREVYPNHFVTKNGVMFKYQVL